MNPLSDCVLSVEVIDNGNDPIVKYETDNVTLYKIRRNGIEGARRRSKAVPTDERKNSPICRFWEDFTGKGVYFYVGHSQDARGLDVYVGKSGNVHGRLNKHKTDVWQNWSELVFIHREGLMMGACTKIEEMCIKLASKCPDVNIVNKNEGETDIPTSLEYKMVNNIMRVLPNLMYVAGYDFLIDRSSEEVESIPEPMRTRRDGTEFTICLVGLDDGKAVLDEEGFWVLAGTHVKPISKYLNDKDRRIYDSLIADGTLKDGVFTRDWLADSPSRAARFITGTTNGAMWDRWKTADKKSVREFMRKND